MKLSPLFLFYYIIVSSLVLRLCLIVLSPVKASALDRKNQCTIVNKYCKIFSLNKVFEVEVKYDSHLNMFAYADELNLVSTTAAGLQSLMNICHQYAHALTMKFNPTKTNIVCISK